MIFQSAASQPSKSTFFASRSDMIDDLWELMAYFDDALEELKVIAGADVIS